MLRLRTVTTLLLLCSYLYLLPTARAGNIELLGTTVLSDTEVANVLAPYKSIEVQAEDIAAIINQLNGLYRSKGYMNSGVVFPQQTSPQIIVLQAIEGGLEHIELQNETRLQAHRITSVIEAEVEGPLNLNDLGRAFSRLEMDRNIIAVKGVVVPGDLPGEARLAIEVVETEPLSLALAANNYRSPSVGSGQLQFSLNHTNMSGNSDVLSFSLNHTDGLNSGSIGYSYPLFTGTRIEGYYSRGDTIVVEAPFDDIDIESEIDTSGLMIKHALIDSPRKSFTLGLGIEAKQSETSLLGLPFDFSRGSVEGETRATILGASLEYQLRSLNQAFSTRIAYRKGLDLLDATILPDSVPDGEFEVLQLQASYVLQGESQKWTLTTAVSAQITNDTLQSFERFALGGRDSVRGFRENQVLRDEAWQWRTALNFALPADTVRFGRLVIYPFFDVGHAKNVEFEPNVRQDIDLASVGVGLAYRVAGFSLNLEVAGRVDEKDDQGSTLQDDGVHVGVRYVF